MPEASASDLCPQRLDRHDYGDTEPARPTEEPPRRFRNGRQRTLPANHAMRLSATQLPHCLACMNGGRRDMREQDHVLELDQRLRNARLIFEHVEAGSQDQSPSRKASISACSSTTLPRATLIRTPSRPEGLHDGCIDQVLRLRTAGRDRNQHVARLRHVRRGRDNRGKRCRLAGSAVIGDFDAEPFEPLARSPCRFDQGRRFPRAVPARSARAGKVRLGH